MHLKHDYLEKCATPGKKYNKYFIQVCLVKQGRSGKRT